MKSPCEFEISRFFSTWTSPFFEFECFTRARHVWLKNDEGPACLVSWVVQKMAVLNGFFPEFPPLPGPDRWGRVRCWGISSGKIWGFQLWKWKKTILDDLNGMKNHGDFLGDFWWFLWNHDDWGYPSHCEYLDYSMDCTELSLFRLNVDYSWNKPLRQIHRSYACIPKWNNMSLDYWYPQYQDKSNAPDIYHQNEMETYWR